MIRNSQDVMRNMATQQQQLMEQIRVGQQRLAELQVTVQEQQGVIHELRQRSASPAGTSPPTGTFMEFMAQQSLQTTQALTKLSEAIDKMDDKGGTVDMKNVGKPFTFKSDEATFSVWVKKLKNYIGAGYGREARLMMDWAEDRAAEPITDEILQAQYPDKMSLVLRVEEALYSNLNSFTEGEAFTLASNTDFVTGSILRLQAAVPTL